MLKLFSLEINYAERIFGLDLMRFIAIMLVVYGHGAYLLKFAFPTFSYREFIDGVDVFFALSGFLIGGILIKSAENNQSFGISQALYFLKRRWFRTLPNYYLVLLLNIILLYVLKNDTSLWNWKFFVFMQNFSTPLVDFFWESWSLSVEEWFYLFSACFLVLSFTLLHKLIVFKHQFLLLIICFIVFSNVYRIVLSYSIEVDRFWWDVWFRKVVLCRFDTLMFGVLGAWLHFYYPNRWKKNTKLYFAIGVLLLVFLFSIDKSTPTFFTKSFYFTMLSVALFLCLPLFSAIKQCNNVMLTKVITHTSILSYSMYLLHLGIIISIMSQYFYPETKAEAIVQFALYLALVYLFSYILYKYFEKPMMDLRDK